MPVRIYDIAKKLGIESKEVLAKAKDLGISAARVPSSSLDKITAEFLEENLRPIARTPAPPPPTPEPIIVVTAPPPPAEPPATFPQPVEEPVFVTAESIAAPARPSSSPVVAEVSAPVAEPVAPLPPPVPPKPGIGDLMGRIILPVRPVREKAPPPPQRPAMGGGRTEFVRRPDPRDQRGSRGAMPPPRPAMSPSRPQPGQPARPAAAPPIVLPADAKIISLKPPIIVRELADKLGKKPFQLIADLIDLKVMANVNQAIDEAVAQRICAKYGARFEVEKRKSGEALVSVESLKDRKEELDPEDRIEDLKMRAPIVTIMGHVDHGKTTLLDVIRKANVAAGEAGGITQHIGAYTITVPHPEKKGEMRQITFLDTPGHAAFSSMRARGANVTDVVILVVAANDGVMPQTLEALSHARAAKVPIIVAVNKCDHPNANPMKVRQQLQERGLVADEWGGDTIFVDVSALTKQGIDRLLEMVLFQSDLLELKANPTRRARGNVIESGLEQGGPTATVLVRKGTLRLGDILICGQYYGKVRALIDEEGKRQKEAGPSVAVRVLGLNGVPEAGLEFAVLEDEKEARGIAEDRALATRVAEQVTKPAKASLESLFANFDPNAPKALKALVKADTQGSVEAIVEALRKIESAKVTLEIVHDAVGTITTNDVALASASKAVILGFHTRIDNGVSELAKREGVQIKLYAIIYELIDQVKEAMAGLLAPDLKETVIGAAEIRKIFELSKGGHVAGCIVANGRIPRGKVRIMRRKGLVYEGLIQTLRRFQDDVNEVRAGMECGIRIDGFDDFQPGDMIEAYSVEKVAAKL